MPLKHPDGSVQGLSSAAIGLFALLIAFIGYTGFNSSSTSIAWQLVDLFHLIPAGLACIFLALVPWRATQRQEPESGTSVEAGRRCFAIGALLTVLAILVFLFRDYLGHHA
jgi:multisubunit Na+/H+ antiporter MnhB subunit